MLLLISPAKTMNFDPLDRAVTVTKPALLKEAKKLVEGVREYSVEELGRLMKMNAELAQSTSERFAQWSTRHTKANSKPALFAYQGDVYRGFDAVSLSDESIAFSQEHLRILSGLYGVLRPLDAIQPYRVEMATRLPTERGKSLYEFWGSRITDELNRSLAGMADATVIDLASQEYMRCIQSDRLAGPILSVSFQERKEGAYRTVGVYSKVARGRMAAWVCRHELKHPDQLKEFREEGYRFNESLSTERQWIFSR